MRDLRADEIDLRIQQIKTRDGKAHGIILLCYKDARVDMDILDETYGPMGWQRTHEFKDGKLYCTVSVWDDKKGCWISKEDVGTESNTEAEKGQASDSFKRANFNWGIGRELYTAPFIWIDASKCNVRDTGRKDKYGTPIFTCNDSFSVASITIENKVITAMTVKNNSTGSTVFTFGKPVSQPAPAPANTEDILCDSCKVKLGPIKAKNGNTMSPADIRDFSRKKFGTCLCPACQKLENGKAKAP